MKYDNTNTLKLLNFWMKVSKWKYKNIEVCLQAIRSKHYLSPMNFTVYRVVLNHSIIVINFFIYFTFAYGKKSIRTDYSLLLSLNIITRWISLKRINLHTNEPFDNWKFAPYFVVQSAYLLLRCLCHPRI